MGPLIYAWLDLSKIKENYTVESIFSQNNKMLGENGEIFQRVLNPKMYISRKISLII